MFTHLIQKNNILYITIIIYSTLDARLIIFTCIQRKCNKEWSQWLAKLKSKKPPHVYDPTEMMPIASEVSNLNLWILRALKKKEDRRPQSLHEIYVVISLQPNLPQKGEEIHDQILTHCTHKFQPQDMCQDNINNS